MIKFQSEASFPVYSGIHQLHNGWKNPGVEKVWVLKSLLLDNNGFCRIFIQ
jgi:hypothetical protein